MKISHKICNMCGKIHNEVPSKARIDERGTAFWECECGTTLVHMTDELRAQIAAFKFKKSEAV